MNKNTITAIKMILNEEYDKKDPVSSFAPLQLGNQLIVAKKGDAILYQNDPVKNCYFLLSGQTAILNQIPWGIDDIIDFVEPPHILGLIECLLNLPAYTAFVVAETKCVLLRISKDAFISLMQRDNAICYKTLLVITSIANSNMLRAEKQRMFPARDLLGHHLYSHACNALPYVYPLTRRDLSKILTINLRSLYRYINDMQEKGYLTLRKGKIVIEEEHFKRLAARYEKVIL